MDQKDKKELLKEFGIAALVFGVFLLGWLFATAAEEFTYAMF